MKKLTKVLLGVAGGFAVFGLICMVTAFAMGLTAESFMHMVREGKFVFDATDLFVIKHFEIETKEDVQIIPEEEKEIKSDEWNFYLGEECNSLDIEFAAGTFDIYYDDVEEIQIQHKNIEHLSTKVENGVLKIREELEISISDTKDRNLTVIIPKDWSFEEVDLEMGASLANIDGLKGKEIKITIGAGQANIANIIAEKLEMEVGAGEAEVAELTVDELDLEVGMGQVNIGLNGVQNDYNCSVECGMGNVVVGHHSYGGLGAEHHGENHHATKRIDVECGMGEVQINFKE